MRRGDRLGDTAGDQLAQHRVQPADYLGAGAAQVAITLGPDLQYRCVIIGLDLRDVGRPQRATATGRASGVRTHSTWAPSWTRPSST